MPPPPLEIYGVIYSDPSPLWMYDDLQQLLVTNYPNYIQYTDACALGSVGVITPGLDAIQYWVWQFEWPDDIKTELVTFANKTGKQTINDLELAALVLG